MTHRAILTIFFLTSFVVAFGQQQHVAEGRTMGTTYRVIYFDEPLNRDFGAAIDSLLVAVNKAISTYDPDSEISRFNKSKKGIRFEGPHFRDILLACREIYRSSGGVFDPTVMPLVDAWGFGPGKSQHLATATIDSILTFVGFDRIRLKRKKVCKRDPRIQLDMGGIGQGYGADVIYSFLKSHGVQHMLIELGGEGMAAGRNIKKDRAWTIGILDPNSTPTHQFFKAYVTLGSEAYTTSGNYFNYKVINGRKHGHTIDPKTGRSVAHTLLSASVFAPNCTVADGWATALMVMGPERAIETVSKEKGLEAVLMYSTPDGEVETYITPGIRERVVLE